MFGKKGGENQKFNYDFKIPVRKSIRRQEGNKRETTGDNNTHNALHHHLMIRKVIIECVKCQESVI